MLGVANYETPWILSLDHHVRLFADDCLVYREIHNLEDQLALQKDLDMLKQWASKWGLSLIHI